MHRRLALAAVLITSMLLAACGETATSQPAPTSPPPASASAQPEPPSGTPEALEGWQRIHDEAVDERQLSALPVVSGANGFLTGSSHFIGQEGGPRLEERTFWHSADGQAWEEVEPPLATDEALLALTTTRDGDFLVLVGVAADEPGEFQTTARVSSDAETWEEVETGLPDNLQVHSIDHGAQGSLLVALEYLPDNIHGAWLSDDGIAWEKVLDLTDRLGEFVTIRDGGAGEEGFVVAGYVTSDDSTSHEYFAFASSDGREWVEAEPEPFGPADQDFRPEPHVASLSSDWLAAMHDRDGNILFWSSADGLDWSEAGTIDRGGEELNIFAPVMGVIGGEMYFSSSGGGTFGGIGNTGIWTSPDGQTWEEADIGPDAYLGGMAVHEETAVISATHVTDDGAGSELGIWIGPAD